MLRKILIALAIGVAAGLLALVLWRTGALDGFEHATWADRVHRFAKPAEATARVKLILLDQRSLEWGEKENGLPWPWPRSVYVPIFDFLKRGGARVLAFDGLFTESSGADSVSQDLELGAAFRTLPSIAAIFPGDQNKAETGWPAGMPRPPARPEGLAALRTDRGAAFPIPEIASNATLLASVKDEPDEDGVFRRVSLYRGFANEALPLLGLAPLLLSTGSVARFDTGEFHVGPHQLPVDDQQRVLLRFRGPSGTHQAFSAAAIIQSELQLQGGEKPTIDPNVFRDCYVFFGASAPGLKDLRPTPVSGDYPGVEIHATLLDNLLQGDSLRDAPPSAVIIGTLLLCIAAAAAVILSRTATQNIFAFVVLLPIPYVAGLGGYAFGWWWPVATGALGVALALTGGVVWNYATEGRQKRFIKSAFNQYVGDEVLQELVAHPEKLSLGGEKRELTMFFSDLEKFSSFSEKMDPPRLIELLNVYLTEMGAILREEGAYVDKFVGDAIVAFWNAPVRQADHAARAVRAALRCQRRCQELRPEWERQFGVTLRMRIGLNTGEVVVGNMGSRDKFNYTMLGDAANAASRLEGANKAFGSYTMIAETTWQQVKGAVCGRELGQITVVGRKAPLRVYESMALPGEALPAWLPAYEAALAAVKAKRWSEAAGLFAGIGDDPVATIYAARCRTLASEPGADWDGIWGLTEK